MKESSRSSSSSSICVSFILIVFSVCFKCGLFLLRFNGNIFSVHRLFCENVFAKDCENEKEMAQMNIEKRQTVLEDLRIVFDEMDRDDSKSITRAEFMDAV